MKFAYADPPYLGLGAKFYGDRHADAADCDSPEWHRALIERLCDEFSDGWALSLHTPTLRTILNMCPDDVRVGAWVKPFAAFKKNVTRAYAWEPIILRGGRKIPITQHTVRDWIEAPAVKESITMRRGWRIGQALDAARTLREANPDLEAVSASLMRRMGATGMCAVLIEHDGKITEVDPWV